MNFLKLSPLTTQPAELSSSPSEGLGQQSKYELFIGPSEQVSVSERRSVSINRYFKPNGKVS